MQNYKERAGSFETNYQNLDILLNRIKRRLLSDKVMGIDDIKEIQREYEKLLIDKENHLGIDYKEAYEDYARSQKRKSKEVIPVGEGKEKAEVKFRKIYKNATKKLNAIQWIELIKYICLALFPVIIILVLLLFEFLIEKFM